MFRGKKCPKASSDPRLGVSERMLVRLNKGDRPCKTALTAERAMGAGKRECLQTGADLKLAQECHQILLLCFGELRPKRQVEEFNRVVERQQSAVV